MVVEEGAHADECLEVFGRQVYLALPNGHVDMFVSPVVHLGKYHYHEMFESKIMLAAFQE